MTIRTDHVQLAMPLGEEDKARTFYGALLGLRELPKPAERARRGGETKGDGTVLHRRSFRQRGRDH